MIAYARGPDAPILEQTIDQALIRLAPGESATGDEIRGYCKGRIAHFKIPQHIRFVEAFPSTTSGKVQKFRIRQLEMEARSPAEGGQAATHELDGKPQ